MNFFKAIKQRFSKQDSGPVYRQYTHAELKIIAMKTRMIFEDLYKKESMKITQADNQFKKVQASQGTIHEQYEVLQQISRKVIETETIKLYVEILKKIEAYAPQIMNTKGDVALMKQQIKWFQCILWYRKCKKLHNIEELDKFCWNFFKGVDITMELNLKCELFKVYEGLEYLDENLIVPLELAIEKIIPYVSFSISQEDLDEMKKINGEEIKKKEDQKKKVIQQNPYGHQPTNQQNSNNFHPSSIPNINQEGINNLPKELEKKPQSQHVNSHPYVHYPEPEHKNTKDYAKLPVQDDQFAQDRNSMAYKPNLSQEKDFKSNDLNLIDWETMHKKNHQEQNPYINNSKIGFLNHDESLSSQENSYDETTMPYPPSGVISFEEINKKDGYYFDTLPSYQTQPVESHINFIKKPQNSIKKFDDDSFLKSIENQFFDNHPKSNNDPAFNQVDLLNEVTQKKPVQSSGKKTLNKLFGFKFKSNVSPVSEPVSVPYGTQSENYTQSNKPEKKTSQIDDILLELGIESMQKPEEKQKIDNFSVDEMLRELNHAQKKQTDSSNGFKRAKQSENLDDDIKSLIQSRKNQIEMHEQSQQTPIYYPDDGERFNDSKIKFSQEMELLNEFESKIKDKQSKESLEKHYEDSSNPQFSHQIVSQPQKNQEISNQFDYGTLEKDLFDSLKIIKNHYGQDLPSHNQETQNSQQNNSQQPKFIKKPYMVSIYARKEYMDGVKLTKHQSCQ